MDVGLGRAQSDRATGEIRTWEASREGRARGRGHPRPRLADAVITSTAAQDGKDTQGPEPPVEPPPAEDWEAEY